jgi:sensor histidine kinase YesM
MENKTVNVYVKKLNQFIDKIRIRPNKILLISSGFLVLFLSVLFIISIGFIKEKPEASSHKIEFVYTKTNIQDYVDTNLNDYAVKVNKHERIMFEGHLKEDVNEDIHIFYQNLFVNVHVNGVLVASTGRNYDYGSRGPGIGWLTIKMQDIPTNNQGVTSDDGQIIQKQGISKEDTIVIEMRCIYQSTYVDQFLKTVNNIYCGSTTSLMELTGRESALTYAIFIIALITGLFCVINALVSLLGKQNREALRFFILGVILFFCSIWCAPSEYMSLQVGDPIIYAALYSLSLPLLMIFTNMAIILSMKKMSKLLYTYNIVVCCGVIIAIFLQLFGVRDIYELAFVGFAVYVVDLFLVLLLLFNNYETFNANERTYNIVKYGTIAIATFADLFVFILTGAFNTTFLRFGVLLYSLTALIEYFRKIKETEELRILNLQLALDIKEKENELFFHQIQPHFLFNSLNCISTLCQIDPERAETAIHCFSSYLRNNMELINASSIITFNQEIKHIEQYLTLHEIRFEDDIILDVINPYGDFEIPALCIEPVAENSINYAFRGYKSSFKRIGIEVKRVEGGHEIIISDNGKGFNVETIGNDGRRHIGIENVRERVIHLFNGRFEMNSEINVGTEVKIFLPFVEKENK